MVNNTVVMTKANIIINAQHNSLTIKSLYLSSSSDSLDADDDIDDCRSRGAG